jgi:hypothetical protein
MSLLAQESAPVQEISYSSCYRSIDPYYVRSRPQPVDPQVLGTLALGILIGITAWGWSMWRLASKAGYRGSTRLIWFALLGCPLTTGWTLLAFVLLPWPVQRELKKVKELPKYSNEIDSELDQLRRSLGQG